MFDNFFVCALNSTLTLATASAGVFIPSVEAATTAATGAPFRDAVVGRSANTPADGGVPKLHRVLLVAGLLTDAAASGTEFD